MRQKNKTQLYAELAEACQIYLAPESCQRIEQAYHFADRAHADQKRQSGDDYITHPLEVALYLARQYVDEIVITGALLHDVAEDTTYSLDDIEAHFGKQARLLVDGVTHLANVSQLEDMAHMLLAMSSDVRIVLVKLYDRLHNLYTLEHVSPERRRRKALETLRIYVPLAAKLGMWELKTEFETLILRHMDPKAYEHINALIDEEWCIQRPQLEAIGQQIQQTLREKNVPCLVRIQRRSLYRMYEALMETRSNGEPFNKAFQIVISVDSLPQCYLALGYIHQTYAHVAGSLMDSIGNPRDIFYRSLHTDVIVPNYKRPVHLRIRTYEFDRLSEIGILTQIQFAHPSEEKQPTQAPWLPELPLLYSESEDVQRFIESVFQDILQKQLTCFTPRGEEVTLPRGATVLDFAYQVHTDIGHECRAAKVNGKLVEITYRLRDRDQVEIVRSHGSEPFHEWLDDTLEYATTNSAKRKIRDWFKRLSEAEQRQKGREIFEEECRRFNINHLSAEQLANYFEMPDPDTFYRQLGSGTISISELARAILKHSPDLLPRSLRDYIEVTDKQLKNGWLPHLGECSLELASCCEPLVKDEIVAHVNENSDLSRTAVVHRADCPYVIRSKQPDTFIRIEWLSSIQPLIVVNLRLEGYDRMGLIRDISIPIAEAGGNIMQIESLTHNTTTFTRIKLAVETEDHLIRIIHRLTTLQNIRRVQRMNETEIHNWHNENFSIAE